MTQDVPLTDDLASMTDDQLLSLFWFSDALDQEDLDRLECELARRKIDPWG